MRFALEWGDGGISKPLRVDPAKRSMGGSRWLDCRGKDGETTRRPHRGSLRPPRFPTVHATDSRNRRSLGLALTAVGGSRPYKTGTIGYSTKCVLWDSANFAFTEFSDGRIAPVDTYERGGLRSAFLHASRLWAGTKSTAIPQGSRTRKPPPSRSSVAMPAARTRSRTASTASGSSSTTVQWRRPTLPLGTGGTPSPRQMLKPRWWW